VRWGRVPGWLAGIVLPLAVCAGLFVMHALDAPTRHSPMQAAAATPHDHDVHRHMSGDEDGEAGAGIHCVDCLSAVHVIVACLAVLATVGVAALASRLCVAGALVTAVRSWARSLARPVGAKVLRPAWVRLNVMLC
jgi:hypothetical protein